MESQTVNNIVSIPFKSGKYSNGEKMKVIKFFMYVVSIPFKSGKYSNGGKSPRKRISRSLSQSLLNQGNIQMQ